MSWLQPLWHTVAQTVDEGEVKWNLLQAARLRLSFPQ